MWSRAGQARLDQARPGQDRAGQARPGQAKPGQGRADGRTGLEGGQSGADYRIQVTKKSACNGIASCMSVCMLHCTGHLMRRRLVLNRSHLCDYLPIREFQT